MERVIETIGLPEKWYSVRCHDESCQGLGLNRNGTREVMHESEARANARAHMALHHHTVDVLEFSGEPQG